MELYGIARSSQRDYLHSEELDCLEREGVEGNIRDLHQNCHYTYSITKLLR